MPSFSKTLLAIILATAVAASPLPQLAGEGQAADALFTDTDNGVGYGIKNAEDQLAGNIATLKGSTGGATGGAAPPPPPPSRRQLDKVSNGFQDMANAAGVGSSTTGLTNTLDNVDGELTSGAANAGSTVGGTEESTLEGAGKAVPKL